MTAGDLVLHDPATYDHGFPYEQFRELRRERPITHHDHPAWDRGYWAIVRHADVMRVSRDANFKTSPHPMLETAADDDAEGLTELLISKDPPEHTRLRKLISSGFTPRRVADLTDRIRDRVAALVDGVAERGGCDLVTDLALWLPLHVIADLVGVPEADRAHVFELTEITFGFDPAVTPAERGAAAMEMYAYADGLCDERRAQPRDDLLSVLLHAEIDGERLTQLQVDIFFLLLQNAGSETTRNLITTGTLALLEHPDQMEIVRADPSRLPLAIEELLRYSTPVMQFTRRAEHDTEIAGQTIAADDRVLMVYASANRDDTVFHDPDGVDVTREPNPHVAFGAGGPHFCLGANLARIEARIMFEALLTRFRGLAIVGDPATMPRVHSNLIDGYAHLPVAWDDVVAPVPS
ncbi:MAG TPA: cytochrome P450 [Acidimicrobiia bacterium]|nr:cytochrome P450 [Acidimicrobiia bacterium]